MCVCVSLFLRKNKSEKSYFSFLLPLVISVANKRRSLKQNEEIMLFSCKDLDEKIDITSNMMKTSKNIKEHQLLI